MTTAGARKGPDIVLVAVMGHDLRLAPRHMQHYRALGVTRILLDIQTGSGNADALLGATRSAAAEHGAEIVSVEPGAYDGTRQRRERLVARHCDPDDWLVIADLDEFHEYPARLDLVVDYCRNHGYDYAVGELVDRVAGDGRLRTLDDRPLCEQFPLGCLLTRNLCGGWPRKVVLARACVPIVEGNHEALAGRKCPENRIYVPVHHFRWDAEVVEKNRFMIESIKGRGLYHWVEKARLLRHLDEHHGRIDVEDARLRTRALDGPVPAIDERVARSGAQALISPVCNVHRRPRIVPPAWLEHSDSLDVVHGPSGTARFHNVPLVEPLWRLCTGRHAIHQLALSLAERLGMRAPEAERALARVLESLRCIGAITDEHPAHHAPSEPEPVRVLYVDDRVPRDDLGPGFVRSALVLRALSRAGAAVILFPAQGCRWDDRATCDALKAVGIGVASTPPETKLATFVDMHLHVIDAVWARGSHNLRCVLEAVSGKRRRPAIVADLEDATGDAPGAESPSPAIATTGVDIVVGGRARIRSSAPSPDAEPALATSGATAVGADPAVIEKAIRRIREILADDSRSQTARRD